MIPPGLLLTVLLIPGGYAHWVFLCFVLIPLLVWLTAGRTWFAAIIGALTGLFH